MQEGRAALQQRALRYTLLYMDTKKRRTEATLHLLIEVLTKPKGTDAVIQQSHAYA